MADDTSDRGSGVVPYDQALLAVVKGLHRDPILLFGIGAAIVVVGAVALTSNMQLAVALIVLLVAVLGARLPMQAQRARRGAALDVETSGTRVRRSTVSSVPEGAAGRVRGRYTNSTIEDSTVGSITPRDQSGTPGGATRRQPKG